MPRVHERTHQIADDDEANRVLQVERDIDIYQRHGQYDQSEEKAEVRVPGLLIRNHFG